MTAAVPSRTARAFAMALATLAWYGLVLQCYVTIITSQAKGLLVSGAVINYFSFFTILTNLLVAVVLTCSLSRRTSNLVNFFKRPTVQTAVAVFIAIVGIVYSLVLRNIWDPEGLQKVADLVLHDAVPLLYVIYWALFVRKDELRVRDVGGWMLYPTIYLAYTMARGATTGWYPYHFLDARTLGYGKVGVNIAVLIVAFVCLSLFFVRIARWMSRSLAR